MEGENSTSGPQPYQPYEAEVTNSPISNTPLWESEPPWAKIRTSKLPFLKLPSSPFRSFQAPPAEASKLPRLLHGAVPYEADQASRGLSTCSRWLYFSIPFGSPPGAIHGLMAMFLLYRLVPARGYPRSDGYVFLYRLLPARGYPRSDGYVFIIPFGPRPGLSTVFRFIQDDFVSASFLSRFWHPSLVSNSFLARFWSILI